MALSQTHEDAPSAPRSPPNNSMSPSSTSSHGRTRASSGASGRLRSASLRILESNPPPGMWHATGEAVAKAPSLAEIRQGTFDISRRSEDGQRRNSLNNEKRTSSSRTSLEQSTVDGSNDQRRFLANPPLRVPFEDIQEDIGDLPEGVFGRGEMADQSYLKSSNQKAQPQSLDTNLDTDLDGPSMKSAQTEKPKSIFGQSTQLSSTSDLTVPPKPIPNNDGTYPNGYRFPPKHTWSQATIIGLKAFWKFTLTPLGFLIVLYGLNVIAWGGMLFLLLIGAAPRMCYPAKLHGLKDCNNIDAPRRIWVETDSQILNALFCVTGFGLAPWRFRDLYYLLKFRIRKNHDGLRKLAGIHRSWFRLPGNDTLPPTLALFKDDDQSPSSDHNQYTPSLALPLSKTPDPPLTGVRAPPTRIWKLDYVIWAYVVNTCLQAVLSGFMWGLDRYDRPSWSTGLFVALACIVAALGGLMAFLEGKKVKRVEGVPVRVEEAVRDAEKGVGRKEIKREGSRTEERSGVGTRGG